MAGVSGSGSISKSAGGINAPFGTPEQSAQSQAATGNTFNLRAKALAVRQGYEGVEDSQGRKHAPNQLDPSVLARMALEEELKKRGGGGGGARSFNPMLWVPYSFKLLARAIEEARQAFMKAISQSLTAVPQAFSQALVSGVNSVNRFFAPVINPVVNALTNMLTTFTESINNFTKNPIQATNRMLMSVVQVAIAITSALINGLKKIIFGRDEDKQELDEKIYESEESQGVLSRLFNFFTRAR